MSDVDTTPPILGEVSVDVDEWQDELVDEVKEALEDMAEVEDMCVEAEATVFTSKLLLQVTEGNRKQAEAVASVLEANFSEQRDEVIYRG